MTDTFFQFRDLPAKLRSMIYKLAIEDIIDGVLCPRPTLLGYYGALALLHGSRTIRAESACEMLPLEAEHTILEAYEHACWVEMQLNPDDPVSRGNWIGAGKVKLMMGDVRFMLLRCI